MAKRVILKSINGKSGNTFVKLNTGDYKSAIKKCTIEFNDGKKVDITGDNTFFPRDPREYHAKMHELGYIDDETLEKRLKATEYINSELILDVE